MYKLIATFALLLGGVWALGGTSDTLASADHDPLDAVRPAVIEADGLDGFALPEGLAGLDGLNTLVCTAWRPTGSGCGAGGCLWKQTCYQCGSSCEYSHTNTTCMTGNLNCPTALDPADPAFYGPGDPGMATWAAGAGLTWSESADDWVDAQGVPLQLLLDRQFGKPDASLGGTN